MIETPPVKQLSPDGMYEWNGTQWMPTQAAPGQQQVAESVPVAQAMPPFQAPPAPKAKKGRRWPWIAGGIIGLLIIASIIGAAAGGGSKQQPSAQSPASSNPQVSASVSAPAVVPAKPAFITFGSGTLIVGKDIKPGTYRTRHDSSNCYFARLKGFSGSLNDIIANDNTDARVVVTIAATDKGFESSNCDTWSSDLSPITTSKTSFGDGDFIVGTDMVPGTYRNTASDNCYWARLSGFSHSLSQIRANNNTDTQAIVTISASDKGFESSNCGTWNKI